MFAYQKNRIFFAPISEGLEELGAQELAALGAENVHAAYRGIRFHAGAKALYRCVYESRLVTRVLAPLLRFDCHSTKYLYRTGRSIDWPSLFTADETFAISCSVAHSAIRHSHYAAQRLKDAIADRFRDDVGRRPDVDRKSPDLLLHLRVDANRATISLDAGGGSLHRRGYRRRSVEAPMQETIAAAIVALSRWEGERPLLDPMCGSGTLLLEALMRGGGIPAAFLRSRFGFPRLPDHDESLWRSVRAEADGRMRTLPPGLLHGSDRSAEALAAARANGRALPGGEGVTLEKSDFRTHRGLEGGVILCNPPHGIRSGRSGEAEELAGAFGDFLKRRCTGSTAYVYFGRAELVKRVGLHGAWKKPIRSGGLDGRLVRYELY